MFFTVAMDDPPTSLSVTSECHWVTFCYWVTFAFTRRQPNTLRKRTPHSGFHELGCVALPHLWSMPGHKNNIKGAIRFISTPCSHSRIALPMFKARSHCIHTRNLKYRTRTGGTYPSLDRQPRRAFFLKNEHMAHETKQKIMLSQKPASSNNKSTHHAQDHYLFIKKEKWR